MEEHYSGQGNVKEIKKRIRETIWRIMEEKNIARFPRPVYGRIPNFIGAEEAAQRLAKTSIWKKSSIIKSNPDSPQQPVRYLALLHGKKVVMATPKLRSGFLVLDPVHIPLSKYKYASTIKGAFKYGRILKLNEIPQIDLVVTGCVAVDLWGGRLGKGGGFAELEYAILRTIGVVDESTYVVTTVHDVQVINSRIPLEKHDLTIDIIFTPTRSIYINPRPPKPEGIYWELLKGRDELFHVLNELKTLIKRNT